MIWKIAKKDLLLNLMTFKFAAGTIVCVILTAVLVPGLINDYRLRLNGYNSNVAGDEAELREAKVYDNITVNHRAYRPPTVLLVFSKGIENQVGDSAKIGKWNIPQINASTIAINPYLAILRNLDISLLYQIILSLLALLMACDAISGERTMGTLMLITSGTVARHEVLLGKVLAGLMTLMLPLTIAFLVVTLILSLSPAVDLVASDWARMGLMYLVSMLFILAVYNGGIVMSCLTRHPHTSLMLGLFFWIILTMIVPNASGYLAAQFRPLEPSEPIYAKLSDLEREYFFKKAEAGDWVANEGHHVEHSEKILRRYTLVCDEKWIETVVKRHAASRPIEMEHIEKVWQIEHPYIETLFRQERLAANLSRVSPVCVYENLMSALAGTDAANCQNFVEEARTHRREVLDYIRDKTDNFSLPSFFTPCTEADRAQYQQYLDGKMSEEDFQKWKEKKIAQLQPLDLQDFPRFICKGDILSDIRNSIVDTSALIFANVLFFALSFVAFMRYDVR
jgi:ABC-type transport system involved in multi-copper enzyme maturation permease subunit